jgi:hypothetical protein
MDQIILYISLGVSLLSMIIGIINHKKIKSRCNNQTIEASLDITNTTPTQEDIKKIDAFIKEKIKKEIV